MSQHEVLDESLEGKRVIGANGEEIGVISGVRDNTAYVDPDPGITDKLQSMLGWKDVDADDYPLPDGAIERIDEDEVVLKSEF